MTIASRIMILLFLMVGSFIGLGYTEDVGAGLSRFEGRGLGYLLSNLNFAFMIPFSVNKLFLPLRQKVYVNRVFIYSGFVILGVYLVYLLAALMAFGGVPN